MKTNKLWIDTETTGLSPSKHGVIQLAMVFEVGGEIVDKYNFKLNPFGRCEYDEKALEINGITREQISIYPLEKIVFKDIMGALILNKHYGKFDIAGYNTSFDIKFFRSLFARNGNPNDFTEFCSWYDTDVFALVKILKNIVGTKNLKLETVCKVYGIKLNAHDAMSDILATRKLYYKLLKIYFKKDHRCQL